MMNKQVYELTQEGLDKLKAELDDLKNVQRPKNIEFLQEARAQGDLSENADYDAAREDQRRIEGRIVEIENILKNVRLIEKDNSGNVSTGKHVNITYVDLGKTFDYDIVGTIEADPRKNRISNDSPLGKALIGRTKGDVVVVIAESGKEHRVKINDVK